MKYFLLLCLTISTAYAKPIKVAVIDTGHNPETQEKYMCNTEFAKKTVNDRNNGFLKHGENIISIIAPSLNTDEGDCIISYNCSDIKDKRRLDTACILVSIFDSTLNNVDIINMSFTAPDFLEYELVALVFAIAKGTVLVAAAGNEAKDIDEDPEYPACNKRFIPPFLAGRFIVVGSTDKSYSNYGKIVNVYAEGTNQGIHKMSGTSFAVPNVIKELIEPLRKQKEIK